MPADGRQMVFIFEKFHRIETVGSIENVTDTSFSWGFRKMSKRHVLWEELTSS